MEPYIERMLQEFKELNGRTEKLAAFTNSQTFMQLPPHKQKLMLWQYSAMRSYQEVLGERIKCEGYDPITGDELEG